jgi:hypothetical protein
MVHPIGYLSLHTSYLFFPGSCITFVEIAGLTDKYCRTDYCRKFELKVLKRSGRAYLTPSLEGKENLTPR